MQKPAVALLPGPAFYSAWSAAMRASRKQVAAFAREHGISANVLRMYALGAIDNERADVVRSAMVAAVDREMLDTVYQAHLRVMRAVA